MLITLLGTGTPILDPCRQGPAVLITIGPNQVLFDAGRGVATQLIRAGVEPWIVNPIFITHHHADHIGDLGDLILAAWNYGRTTPLQIFGPQGTAEIVSTLLDQIYIREIKFRLALKKTLGSEIIDIRELVKVTDIEPGLVYDNGIWQVKAEYVEHGHSIGLSQIDWPCLGYRVEAQNKIVAISGDAIVCKGLYRLAQGANALIQCCYLADAEITNSDLEFLSKYVIASSTQVGAFASRVKVKKLVLTHFRKKSDAMMRALESEIRNDYAGDLFLGQDLMVIKV
ncbi:MAG: MBL fold metallo-hydrolase [Promethearchaeota archaeon]